MLKEFKEISEDLFMSTIDKEFMVSFDYDELENKGKIEYYHINDLKCLYMWIAKKSGILKEFDPAVVKNVIEVLV